MGCIFYLLEHINKENTEICCVISNKNGMKYNPFVGYKEDVYIVLFPFAHYFENNSVGEFIAEYPVSDFNINDVTG